MKTDKLGNEIFIETNQITCKFSLRNVKNIDYIFKMIKGNVNIIRKCTN